MFLHCLIDEFTLSIFSINFTWISKGFNVAYFLSIY